MTDPDGSTIAVVDDDPDVLDSLKFLLEVAGHRVTTYGSAVEFLAAGAPRPACLILDHHMPQMTGLELVGRLRRDGTRIPTLLITGSPAPSILARAAQLGVERVLEKPPAERELLSFIEAYR